MTPISQSLQKKKKWLLLALLPFILRFIVLVVEAAIGDAVVRTVEHLHLIGWIVSNPAESSIILTCAFVVWVVTDAKIHATKERENQSSHLPNITVDKNGFRSGHTSFIEPHADPSMVGVRVEWLRLYFTNRDTGAKTREARNVFVRMTFYNVDGETRKLFSMYGRWVDGAYPWQKPRDELILNNIRVGQEAGLDVAIKYLDEDDCYAMNNSNWEVEPGNLKYDRHRLIGQNFLVTVEVRAVDFVKTWNVKFQNGGPGRTIRPIFCLAT